MDNFQNTNNEGKWAHPMARKPWGIIILVGILLSIFLGLKSWEIYQSIRKPGFDSPTFSIDAMGRVFVKPDIGEINLAVSAEDENVEVAQNKATEAINEVFSVLKEKGVEEKDIKTTNYSISPQYEFPDGERRLIGYQVMQNLQVKIRDLNKVGEILQSAAVSGANQVGGLSFTTEDPENLQMEARNKAIEEASRKAEDLSKKLGIKLGRVVGFSEFRNDYPGPYFYGGLEKNAAGAPVVPVGENEIVVNVSVTYEIR